MKKNVFWHDGRNFNADDVVFTVQTVKDDKVKSSLKEAFSHVNIKKINDYLVEFSLEKPFSPFLSLLTFGILPKHRWQKVNLENFAADILNLSPLGTGPFKFKNLTRSEKGQIKKITLERNKKYYLGGPYLEKINFRTFPNYDEATEALMTKKVDGLAHYRKIDDLEAAPKTINSYKIPLSYYTAIFFDEFGALANKKIREALVYAIDKKEMVNQLKNIELIEAAIVNPQFRLEKVKKYDFSQETAEKKLKEAGYQKKNEWFVDKKGKKIEIKLVATDRPVTRKVGEIIKNFWEAVGIKTNLSILGNDDFKKAIKENDYDAILGTLVEGYDPDPFPIWHSSQQTSSLNLSNFKDIRVDSILEKARLTEVINERKKHYEEFQKIMADNLPAFFLYQTILSYYQIKKIKGFEASYFALPADRFSQIENWYISTRRGIKIK